MATSDRESIDKVIDSAIAKGARRYIDERVAWDNLRERIKDLPIDTQLEILKADLDGDEQLTEELLHKYEKDEDIQSFSPVIRKHKGKGTGKKVARKTRKSTRTETQVRGISRR